MILTCQRCGGLYATGKPYETFAGTPCVCGWPREKTLERPEVSWSEWVDALKTALGYWKQNADQLRKDGKTLEQRHDYEAGVYHRCKAVCDRASTEKAHLLRDGNRSVQNTTTKGKDDANRSDE